MTPQEQQLIDGLVQRIKSTPVAEKDDEADRYLHSQLDNVPDVLYVLAQTVLVQQYGLNNAQQQLQDAQQRISDLEQQLQQAQQQPHKSGSFLSHLLGTDQQPQQPQQPPAYQPVNTGYAAPPPPSYAQPAYAPPASYPYAAPSGGGGFLRGAMQTAAGVAAGEMMFQGMEDLFHGFGGGGGYGGGFGEGRPTEVINNYYDQAPPEHHDLADNNDNSFYNPSDDASRQDFGDTDNFTNTGGDDFDDSGNFDDGGGGFDDNSF